MKKMFSLTIAAGLVVCLAGCNGSGSNSQASNSGSPASVATTAAKASAGAALQPLDSSLLANARPVGACALDQIDGAQVAGPVHLKKGGSAKVTGWSSDEKKMARDHVTFVLAGQQSFGVAIPTGQPRPDVAASLQGPGLANAGFSEAIDFSAVPAGDYAVKILVQEPGDSQICATEKHLVID
jgi:hypothetical protein